MARECDHANFRITCYHNANTPQCTKFEVSKFSHSRDIIGRTRNLNGSHDNNEAVSGVT